MAYSLTIWHTIPGAFEARVSWLGGHADDYCFPVLSPLSGSASPAMAPHWTQSPSYVLADSATKHTALTYLGKYMSQEIFYNIVHISYCQNVKTKL